jgi:hypothetical protein
VIHFFMLLAGLVLAAWNTWQRLGRSSAARGWARGMRRQFVERNVLVLYPLLACALLLGAALGVAEGSTGATVAVGLPLAATLLLWLAYAVLPLPVPGFVKPRWYRELAVPGRGQGASSG